MQLKLLDMLACPKCQGALICHPTENSADQEVVSGGLKCKSCRKIFPIRSSIPRFVPENNYAMSFGFQWNHFRFEQIDANTGRKSSEGRFYTETGWTNDWMKGKWILDAGCGAGRFLDIASRSSCDVVGVDISNAVDAAAVTMRGRRNVHLVQADIYELPFKQASFDACYSIGVIQHTPDPAKAIQSLPRLLKKNGEIALTVYERKPWTLLNAKYIIRPLTKRLNKHLLLLLLKMIMPICYPVTALLYRIPFVGHAFMFVLPIAHYAHLPGLSLQQRYRCVTLDTFDMLSPQYDSPQTCQEVKAALSSAGIVNIRRLDTYGVNLVGQKQ